MNAKFLSILIAGLFAVSGVEARADEGAFKLFGSVGAGGIGTSETSDDAAKLKEYRDLSTGPFGIFDLRGRSQRFYLDAYGENLGRDDSYFTLRGGMYDQFKFSIYGDWLRHNFGFGPDGGRTPYTDPGSTNLVFFSNDTTSLGNPSVPSWTSLNFDYERRILGATFEFSFKSPWYFLVDASQVRQSGIDKVDSAALGTSPGDGFTDLPEPVDYTTRNISGEVGYDKPRGHFEVNLMQSNFNNNNLYVNFANPFFGFGQDTTTLAPGNHYARVSGNGMMRQLPWNSTLSARFTYDKSSDSQDMIDAVLNTTGSNVLSATDPGSQVFHGDVEDATGHVSWASLPTRRLDTRAYYNYYKRSNDSTDISFQTMESGLVCSAPSPTSSTNLNVPCEGERYSYTKQNPGVETGYRLTPGNRFSANFDYLDTHRNRFDSNATRDKKTFVQWSNTSLDTLTVRIKYQYLQRRSDFQINNIGFDPNDPFYLERFSRSFDVANLDQHIVKADLDWTPVKLLDFGLEVYYKRNNYKDLTLGRLNDRRKEIYGSVSYGDPQKFRATLFGDFEFINYDSYHRTVNASPCPTSALDCFDPTLPPTTTGFNWGAKLHDLNWTVEFGTDWPIRENLTFKTSALVQQTRGGVDFQSQTLSTGVPAALLFPITAYDNTRRWSVNPHVVYRLARQAELDGGYAFDKYTYSDDQYAGYQYTIGTGTSTSYLSGAYAFPNYSAHIVYGAMRYLF
jgi:hypothetical protein